MRVRANIPNKQLLIEIKNKVLTEVDFYVRDDHLLVNLFIDKEHRDYASFSKELTESSFEGQFEKFNDAKYTLKLKTIEEAYSFVKSGKTYLNLSEKQSEIDTFLAENFKALKAIAAENLSSQASILQALSHDPEYLLKQAQKLVEDIRVRISDNNNDEQSKEPRRTITDDELDLMSLSDNEEGCFSDNENEDEQAEDDLDEELNELSLEEKSPRQKRP